MDLRDFKEGCRITGHVTTLWAVVSNTDLTEGRGAAIDVSYHATQAAAEIGSKGQGVFGSDARVEKRLAIEVSSLDDHGYEGPSVYVLLGRESVVSTKDSLDELRQKILDKLTPAERTILGVSA